MSDAGNTSGTLFQLVVSCPGRPTAVVPLIKFPFTVGRSGTCDLALNVPGVWDRHVRFELDPSEGLFAVAQEKALVRHAGELIQRHRARNGDSFQAGSVSLQVALGTPLRRLLGFWEAVLWVIFAAVVLTQLGVAWALILGNA